MAAVQNTTHCLLSLSNIHASSGKVSSEYSAALAQSKCTTQVVYNKVLFSKKEKDLLIFPLLLIEKGRPFLRSSIQRCYTDCTGQFATDIILTTSLFPANSEVPNYGTRVMWSRWTQEVVSRDGAARHNELDPYQEDSDIPSGDDGDASAVSAAGRTGAAGGQCGRDDGCAGGGGGEVPELAVRPQVQVLELLLCCFYLLLGRYWNCYTAACACCMACVSLISDLILFVQCGKQSAHMKETNAYDTASKQQKSQLFLHYLIFLNLSCKVNKLLNTPTSSSSYHHSKFIQT